MRTKLSLFCDKLIEAGWLAAAIAVPLFFNIHSNRVFEPDKLSLLRSIALVMAGAWLIRTVEDWRTSGTNGKSQGKQPSLWQRLRQTPLAIPTLLLVLVYLVSTAFSLDPGVSLVGSYQRLQGTYTTLSYIVVFALMLQGMRTKAQFSRLITTVILVSFPIAMYGLVQHFGLDPLPWGGDVERRVASNMGNAIFVAAFLIMVVPLTFTRLLENWKAALDDVDVRDGLLGVVAFVLMAGAVVVGMLVPVSEDNLWVRLAAIFVGVALQIPIYFLSPGQRRTKVLTISLPLTFAFLVAFSWILELFFPPAMPNYFWLGLLAVVLFVLAMAAFAYYLRKPLARLLLLAGYFVILIAQLACIFYTQSRGPLLGLLAGLFVFLLLLSVVRRQLWASWVMYSAAAVLVVFLVLFNTVDSPFIERLREIPYVGRLGRVLETQEGSGRVRVLIWEGAVDLIGWHEPLQWPGEDGGPDRFNALRPIIGYGPESMYVAYNHVYPPDLAHFEKRNASPDRSHNETLDALVTTGWLGGAIYLLLFGSVFYYAFKWLGLIGRPWQRWALIGLWAGGSILGMIGVCAWRGPAYMGVGIPLGAMAGVVLYILIVLGLATRDRETWLPEPRAYQFWVLALISAIAAHFVEIQFGIAIAATRTYFWLYAAAMVVVGSRLMLPTEEPELESSEAKTEAGGAPSKRRRRKAAANPEASPAVVQRRAWLGSLLVVSAVSLLVLSTILFNATTPQEGYPGPLETLWRSLTRSGNEQSLVMLVLFLSTWAMLGMASLSELAIRGHAEGKKPADWMAAVGIFALITLGGALVFGIFHAVRLRPVAISQDAYANPMANTITFYYVALFLQVLALGLVLAYRSRHSLRTLAWRWTGQLADAAVAGLVVFLPVLAGLAIFVSNISIVRADIVYKQALSSERVRQWDAAIFLYEQAVDIADDQDFYHLFLGRAYIEKARLSQGEERQIWLQESERALTRAREIAPLNTDHSRNLAKLYLSWASFSTEAARQPLLEQALEFSADATQLSPNTADIWNERAQIYLAMDDYDQAEAMYRHSLSLDDQYLQTHLSLGQLYTSQKEWESAIQAFNTAAELQPKAADAYSMLGYAYSQQGSLEEAAATYEQAVELRPRNYLDRKNLAIVYSQLGQNDAAIREATEALTLAPENQKPSLESFLAQLGSGQPVSSPQDAQQLQELLDAGQVQLQAEDWPAALDSYNQVLELDPSNAVAHSALAYIYARQGDLDSAIAENLAVVSLLPNDYNSYKNLAILYRQKGMTDEAIGAAETALTLAPEQDKEALRMFIDEAKGAGGQSSSNSEPGTRAGDLPPAQRDGMYSSPPPLVIDPEKTYQATIVTEKGDIVVDLFADRAPETVNNFVFLAREGFYDDTTFHRVLPGFMAQAGDPTGSGRGGPGYRFADEFHPELRHDGPGILSMANSGANTNGSQFFITYEATPWLDDRHAVFGQVVEGIDVLNALTPRDPTQNPSFAGDKILRITIQEQ